MGEFFDLTQDERSGVAELVFNQPQRLNTMTPAFFPTLCDAVRQLDDAGATPVLLIRSTGKHFCAGMRSTCLPTWRSSTPRTRAAGWRSSAAKRDLRRWRHRACDRGMERQAARRVHRAACNAAQLNTCRAAALTLQRRTQAGPTASPRSNLNTATLARKFGQRRTGAPSCRPNASRMCNPVRRASTSKSANVPTRILGVSYHW